MQRQRWPVEDMAQVLGAQVRTGDNLPTKLIIVSPRMEVRVSLRLFEDQQQVMVAVDVGHRWKSFLASLTIAHVTGVQCDLAQRRVLFERDGGECLIVHADGRFLLGRCQ